MINRGRRQTADSLLSYFINQLDNFDPKLYEPLVSVSWARDIKLRSGISFANESTSFTRQAFSGNGTLANSDNMPWVSAETDAIAQVMVNGQRIVLPLRLLAREISYSQIELQRSMATQQPLDVQLMNAMNMLYQMNIDQMVYIGASSVSASGLVNDASITSGSVANGISGSPLWTSKTPDEILADVNTLLTDTWQAAAYAVCPSKLILPPAQFAYIASQKVSSAGNVSILKFLQENSIALKINGKELDIAPVKWLVGRGAASADRMVAYTNDESRVRFPMVPIQRQTTYYKGIKYFAPYVYAFGQVEFVYPETVQYADGI